MIISNNNNIDEACTIIIEIYWESFSSWDSAKHRHIEYCPTTLYDANSKMGDTTSLR